MLPARRLAGAGQRLRPPLRTASHPRSHCLLSLSFLSLHLRPSPSFPYFPLASYVPCYLTFLSS